jgi:hypothetical protein
MAISPDTERAQKIMLKESQIVELLRTDEFASDASIARTVGCGHGLVRRVRQSLPRDETGLIAPLYVRPDLPRTPQQARALKERDLDDAVNEIARLLDENALLRSRIEELELRAA